MQAWFMPLTLVWAMCGFFWDIGRRRLPNVLNGVGVLLAVACLVIAGQACSQATIEQCLWGGVFGLVGLLPFWVFRLMGAGDVKFFAVMGLLAGAWILPPVFIIGSLIAGVIALVFLLARSGLLVGLLPTAWMVWLDGQVQRGLPFGAALALGFCVSLLAGFGQPERVVDLLLH